MEKETYLTYLEDYGSIKYPKQTVRLFKCLCKCGNITIVRKQHFENKHTMSCGCRQKEIVKERSLTHGMSNTSTYRSWAAMITRCTNKNIEQYKDYGARGISVCDDWKNSFKKFLSDMGEKPTKNHSIERLDNNGNYEPSNCKWATRTEQCSNKSNSAKYNYKGEFLTVTEISRRSGIGRSTISGWRNRNKFSTEKIEKLINEQATT